MRLNYTNSEREIKIPTFIPLWTSLCMSRKSSFIISPSGVKIFTYPSFSRIKRRWDPSPQCTAPTGCLNPLTTSWIQKQLCLCFLKKFGKKKVKTLFHLSNKIKLSEPVYNIPTPPTPRTKIWESWSCTTILVIKGQIGSPSKCTQSMEIICVHPRV